MKRITTTLAALGLAASLAACTQREEPAEATATSEAPAPAAPSTPMDKMADMPMSGQAKMAKGTGTVTAVDPAAGTITLDHAPIPEANWPAMTMSFKAAPQVAQAVKVGDKVAFDVRLEGGSGEVTAITKQ